MKIRLWKTKCERKGHKWFPDGSPSEFLPMHQVCFRGNCTAQTYAMPWGECMGFGRNTPHPIAEHYTVSADGVLFTKETIRCAGPW